MIRRFRVVAGPNGSGKSTLVTRLATDYAVNFYTLLNADDVYAHLKRTRSYFAPLPVDGDRLVAYVNGTQFPDGQKEHFRSGAISAKNDCIRFSTDEAVNSYTVAMLVNFLQDEFINAGISFSQETVFSHPSKVDAIKKAADAGFRTYLYYVAAEDPAINAARVRDRYAQGGHNVPADKIVARYGRSLANAAEALPHLSRAFFFDNSGSEMRFLASYSSDAGFDFHSPSRELPRWFMSIAKG